jgi:eukaryotic-like serine/threonine-protein kinase
MQPEQLGPYRLGKKLGQGGMGAVYEGVDTETGEPAAIKVLAPALAAEEGFRARFEAEIESLKKLSHPNIVKLYGYGEQAGTLFYAMELVPGTSLEDELRGGRRFQWREVTQMAIKLSRALKHAHDHGVIHRDLKPANLLLTPDGEIKLSDFGIARLFGNTRMTADGGVLGTAEYMAPEQADGRPVTERCDQYSLGGVLYALLAGRAPFRAKTLVEMLQLQRYAEPETPEALVQIIHQLLDKDPQRRFANTLILARTLEAMERGLSISVSRDDDFVVAAGEGIPSVESAGSLPSTLTPTQLGADANVRPGKPMATEATMAFAPQAEQRAEPPVEPPAPATVFTKVEPRQHEEGSVLQDALGSLLAPQTLALAAALAVVLGLGWYLIQPPSADKLYNRIEAATAEGDLRSLRTSSADLDLFLKHYPDDPRADAIRSLQDDLDAEAREAHPVQRAYTEAKRYQMINPELAAARFQALIDVYDDKETSEAARHYVNLARLRLKELEKQIARQTADGRSVVEARLARAAELAATDPAAARRIYQGIVALYSDKPWAAQLVEEAKGRLAGTVSNQASTQREGAN